MGSQVGQEEPTESDLTIINDPYSPSAPARIAFDPSLSVIVWLSKLTRAEPLKVLTG